MRIVIALIAVLLWSLSYKSYSADELCLLSEARELRRSAYELHKKGWNGLAVERSKKAIEIASACPGISLELIESYDDTGLYFFLINKFDKSAYYQLIATALAENSTEHYRKSSLYKRRLGWALNRYSMDIGCVNNKCNATKLACYNFLGVKSEKVVSRVIGIRNAQCLNFE